MRSSVQTECTRVGGSQVLANGTVGAGAIGRMTERTPSCALGAGVGARHEVASGADSAVGGSHVAGQTGESAAETGGA